MYVCLCPRVVHCSVVCVHVCVCACVHMCVCVCIVLSMLSMPVHVSVSQS